MAYKIAALMLAAGMSRRAGTINKLLAPIDGVPMARRSLDVLVGSRCAPVYVVTGHEAQRVESALGGKGVRFVFNEGFADGMGASIASGIKAMPADVDGVLIGLGDMPTIQTETCDALIKAFAPDQGKDICIPSYNGKRGNPVLFGRQWFAALELLTGDVGGRTIIQNNKPHILDVLVDDPGIHIDHDVI